MMSDYALDFRDSFDLGTMQFNQGETEQPRPLACVRCHQSKLRCTRNSSSDCERCLETGNQCIARAPQRMGRPRDPTRRTRRRKSANKTAQTNAGARKSEGNAASEGSDKPFLLPRGSEGDFVSFEEAARPCASASLSSKNFWDVNGEDRWYNDKHQEFDPNNMFGQRGHHTSSVSTYMEESINEETYQEQHETEICSSSDEESESGDTLEQTFQHIPPSFKRPHHLTMDMDNIFGPVSLLNDAPGLTQFPSRSPHRPKVVSPHTLTPTLTPNTTTHHPASETQPNIYSSMPDFSPSHDLSSLCLTLFQCSERLSSLTTPPGNDNTPAFTTPSELETAGPAPSSSQAWDQLGVDAILQASQRFIEILQPRPATPLPTSPSTSVHRRAGNLSISSISSAPDMRRASETPSSFFSDFPSHANQLPPGGVNHARIVSESQNMYRKPIDSATILLVVACYVRLLQVYGPFFDTILHTQQQRRLQLAHQLSTTTPPLFNFSVGNFTAPSSSELQTVMLVETVSHLTDRIEKSILVALETRPVENNTANNHGVGANPHLQHAMTNGMGDLCEFRMGACGGRQGLEGGGSRRSSSGFANTTPSSENGVQGKLSDRAADALGVALQGVVEDIRVRNLGLRKTLKRLRKVLQQSTAL